MSPSARPSTIQLVAATPELLQQALGSSAELGRALGVRVPDDWVENRIDSLRFTLSQLQADPGAAHWWTYLLIHLPDNTLVGSGGYHGPPTAEGVVELGYEVADEYRSRGLATAFAGALVEQAFTHPSVTAIMAHTLAVLNASTRVLLNHRFTKVADLYDQTEGPLWRWELKRAGS
ncbi:GNAT family N-acetyltransferase [Hymenobacter sp. RP-2-7]|uniref:GNAT family N-acetyltransferase n=1 Tax=Hymenobacter polaris TaxID=2682546 RepID=A0A7Y0ACF2_9BACT|nr:GNAT family N-acetyltransferase [Hymenobacter polaris]NML64789.1 GNAT family N-acetyltransferase [Hymenobacter polaris]